MSGKKQEVIVLSPRMRNLLMGMGCAFDITGSYFNTTKAKINLHGLQSDYDALKGDWHVVSEDFIRAQNELEMLIIQHRNRKNEEQDNFMLEDA